MRLSVVRMAFECVREGRDGVYIDLHVVPGSKKAGIDYDEYGKRLRIKVLAPATDRKANKAVVEFFSALFGECVIVFGPTSRKKTILVRGQSYSEVLRALEEKLRV